MTDRPQADQQQTSDVIFGTRDVADGLYMGLILLNRPERLNAMDTEMFAAMNRQLDSWEHDDHVVGLAIAGAGDRAFCAGGDVVSLRDGLIGSDDTDVDCCFDEEYLLDSRLHQWTKPLIVVAHGICMGGGLGLMMAGSHRVVTPKMRIAMPEVKIGFYPDVGACGFLNELPNGVGRTLTITGMALSSEDAFGLGLATAYIDNDNRLTLWDQIADLGWSTNEAKNHSTVDELFGRLSEAAIQSAPLSQVENHLEQFSQLADTDGIAEFGARLSILGEEHDFFKPPAETFERVSPTSLVLTDRYFKLSGGRSPIEVLRTDEVLSKRYIREPDFAEGVRSVLVAKDASPCWQFDTVSDVDRSVIDRLLSGL